MKRLIEQQSKALSRAMTTLAVSWLLAVLLLSFFVYREVFSARIESLRLQEAELIGRAQSVIERELSFVRQLVLLLKHDLSLQRALTADHPLDLTTVEQVFSIVSRFTPSVAQLRWIDADGQEQVRVNVIDGRPMVVDAKNLQNKSRRYYFRKTQEIPADQVYLSPIDLNVERGEIVEPFEPTLRAAIVTGRDDVLRAGVLVVNYNLASLLSDLREFSTDALQFQLLNSNGYWLLHPDPEKEWGWQLQQRANNVQSLHPFLWQAMTRRSGSGKGMNSGFLWYFRKIENSTGDMPGQSATGLTMVALTVTAPGVITAAKWRAFWIATTVATVLLLSVGFLLWRLDLVNKKRLALTRQLDIKSRRLERTIARLKNAYQNLKQLQEELVETRKLSALGMTVAGVAHELNTPTGGAKMMVSTLQGQLQNLKSALEHGLNQEQLVSFIGDADEALKLASLHLDRSGALIKSFKRLALDRSVEQPSRFAVAQPVQDLVYTLSTRFKGSAVELVIDIAEELTIDSYPGIFSQVLQNLIENALFHGFNDGQEGVITVSARALPGGEQLQIEVRDNGNGIDPSVRDRLFDPFVTSRRGQGRTGLGLHLVHQWVYQILEGKLSVESEPGAGSCFTLTLPISVKPAGDCH